MPALAHSSCSAKAGRYAWTGVSQSSFPSSTRTPRLMTVNALVADPMAKSVSGVTGRFRFTSRRP